MRFKRSNPKKSNQLPKRKFGFDDSARRRAMASDSMNLLSDTELNSEMSERTQQNTGSINTGPLSQRTFRGRANRSSTNSNLLSNQLEIEDKKRKKINTDKAKRNRSSSARNTALSQSRRKSY
tara:strand:- start:9034 stop:9402 length:369 start_codon:yes stop_codon:yes gene_type:complete